jgi:iron complex outermembrane receptor protein
MGAPNSISVRGFVDNVRFRAGHADYRHDEIEDNGEIGTSFFNKGVEGRLEFVQSTRDGWGGGFGAQYFRRSLNIVGEEKFLPRTTTEQYGVFTLQTFDLGAVSAEAGARYEHSVSRAQADADIGNPRLRRSFNAFSGRRARATISAATCGSASTPRTASARRQPKSCSPAAPTQAPVLRDRRSQSQEGKELGTGRNAHCSRRRLQLRRLRLPQLVRRLHLPADYRRDRGRPPRLREPPERRRYFGVEFEASVRLAQMGKFAINADGVADYVRATIIDIGPAPRIPPFRLLGGLEAQSDNVQARVEVERVAAQNRLAEFETRTDGYTMVNASLSFKPFSGNASTILLSANNIFDVDARRHASFLKDFAPLAGRDLRVTARISF